MAVVLVLSGELTTTTRGPFTHRRRVFHLKQKTLKQTADRSLSDLLVVGQIGSCLNRKYFPCLPFWFLGVSLNMCVCKKKEKACHFVVCIVSRPVTFVLAPPSLSPPTERFLTHTPTHAHIHPSGKCHQFLCPYLSCSLIAFNPMSNTVPKQTPYIHIFTASGFWGVSVCLCVCVPPPGGVDCRLIALLTKSVRPVFRSCRHIWGWVLSTLASSPIYTYSNTTHTYTYTHTETQSNQQ